MENTFVQNIKVIMARDLRALATEIIEVDDQYLWIQIPGIINPVGVLAMHICGNLKFFIGSVLGENGYIRQREKEFEISHISKQTIIKEIEETIEVVESVLDQFPDDRIHDEMPVTPPHHKGRSIEFFLIQLCCHLSRHRGQLNYIQRMAKGL